jgi:hypothetical protein
MGKRRGAYTVLVGKPQEKKELGRPSYRWEDIIKMDLQGVRLGWGGGAWTGLICFGIGTDGEHF